MPFYQFYCTIFSFQNKSICSNLKCFIYFLGLLKLLSFISVWILSSFSSHRFTYAMNWNKGTIFFFLVFFNKHWTIFRSSFFIYFFFLYFFFKLMNYNFEIWVYVWDFTIYVSCSISYLTDQKCVTHWHQIQ